MAQTSYDLYGISKLTGTTITETPNPLAGPVYPPVNAGEVLKQLLDFKNDMSTITDTVASASDNGLMSSDMAVKLAKLSFDTNNDIAIELIPDLSGLYAAITSGKISATAIPDLSANYAKLTSGKIDTSVIPDLSSSYAAIVANKISIDIIPDLSSSYAALTSNKIAISAIPDISADYAKLTSGKISASVIPDISNDYAAVIDGKIDDEAVPDLSTTYNKNFVKTQYDSTSIPSTGLDFDNNNFIVISTGTNANVTINAITEADLKIAYLCFKNTDSSSISIGMTWPTGLTKSDGTALSSSLFIGGNATVLIKLTLTNGFGGYAEYPNSFETNPNP